MNLYPDTDPMQISQDPRFKRRLTNNVHDRVDAGPPSVTGRPGRVHSVRVEILAKHLGE